MKTIRPSLVLLCACVVIASSGCKQVAVYTAMWHYDREIRRATMAIESAQNDAQRAESYARRGDVRGGKARYSRAFKLVSDSEYDRLLEMSVKDHDQSIALAPGNAEMYYRRGHTYYMQAAFGTFDSKNDPKSKAYFENAKLDFSKAVELDPRHAMAFEYRGMANEGTGDLDPAIADYTQLAELQPKLRYRLADAHCNRGLSYMREKKFDLAASDFGNSIEIGSSADGCSCEPYNPLLAIYLLETPDYDKAREVARRAQASRKWIGPEYLEKLKQAPTR
jgi:tetratricopeptide (TPR) repeat protein